MTTLRILNRKPLEAGAGNQYNGHRERMMNSMILLKNGCVHNGRGQVSTTDLLIDGGKIVKIGEHLEASGADVIDAAGMHVFPGFIDPLSDWGILGPGPGNPRQRQRQR